MDVILIDKSTWKPTGSPIKRYDSFIWSERYFEDGDFELKTKAIEYTRALLPMETLISVRDSGEIMIVEEHAIDTDAQGFETLTVKGRSLTSYTKHRTIGNKRRKRYRMAQNYTNLDAGLVLLWNSFINPNAQDVTRGVAATYKNTNDKFNNWMVTESSDASAGPVKRRFCHAGPMDVSLRKFLNRKPYGIRIVRPPRDLSQQAQSCDMISVANDGVITKLPNSTWIHNSISLDVYSGVDRSHTQSTNTPVVFDTELDDLIAPNYVQSIVDYKGGAYILTDQGVLSVYADENHPDDNQTAANMTGLRRRMHFYDAGEPEDGYNQSEWDDHSEEEALEELAALKRKSLVDGEVSFRTKIQYRQDYELGDIVSVRGKYTPLYRARVTEYIRVDDENGEKSYPALTYI